MPAAVQRALLVSFVRFRSELAAVPNPSWAILGNDDGTTGTCGPTGKRNICNLHIPRPACGSEFQPLPPQTFTSKESNAFQHIQVGYRVGVQTGLNCGLQIERRVRRSCVLRLCSVKNRARAQNENCVFSIARMRCRKRNVLCFQFAVVFPSWTSRVRVPSPAPIFSMTCISPLHPVLRLCSDSSRISLNPLK